jgi:glutamate-1-semialdehyde aminotransferase
MWYGYSSSIQKVMKIKSDMLMAAKLIGAGLATIALAGAAVGVG